MEIKLVTFSETEVQLITDEIQKRVTNYPSDLQVLEALKDIVKTGFPGFKVKQITTLNRPNGIQMILTKGK